jgi:hypothetical protein
LLSGRWAFGPNVYLKFNKTTQALDWANLPANKKSSKDNEPKDDKPSPTNISPGASSSIPSEAMKIAEAIRGLNFTPFVGVGRYEDLGDLSKAREQLASRVNKLKKILTTPHEINYLETVVNEKFGSVANCQSFNNDHDNSYIDFIATIVRLGVEATKVLSQTIGKSLVPITYPKKMRIDLKGNCSGALISKLCKSILDAQDSLSKIDDTPNHSCLDGNDSSCFSKKNVMRMLSSLMHDIFSDDLGECLKKLKPGLTLADWKKKYSSKMAESESNSAINKGGISLTHLEWIANLLWYCMRFDFPLPPTQHDLAFRFSLCSPTIPITIARPGIAALAFQEPKVLFSQEHAKSCAQNKIYSCLGSSVNDTFAETLADVLLFEHDKWIKEKNTDPNIYPIAVLNTMEDSIQRAILKKGKGYVTVLPVKVPAEAEQLWLLKTIVPNGESTKENWFCFRELDSDEFTKNAELTVGPIIFPVRGAPLESLPRKIDQIHKIQGASFTTKAVKHFLQLSTPELIKSNRFSTDWPTFLNDLLNDARRAKYYIGYHLDDPDEFMAIHQHAWLDQSNKNTLNSRPGVIIDTNSCDHFPINNAELITNGKYTPIGLQFSMNSFNDFAAQLAQALVEVKETD